MTIVIVTWKSWLALTIVPSLNQVILGVGVPVTVVTKRAGVPSGTVRSAKGLTDGGTSVTSGTKKKQKNTKKY